MAVSSRKAKKTVFEMMEIISEDRLLSVGIEEEECEGPARNAAK